MLLDTFDALKHILWPTRCASCEVLLPESSRSLCEECQASVLDASGMPLPENIDWAFAFFRYEGTVQSLIAKWKYHEDYAAQKAILDFLPSHLEAIRSMAEGVDCMIPVPPHPRRLRERGFDPVWSFASKLHRMMENASMKVDFRDDVLMRTRHTAHQAGLNHEQRMHNLDGAFKVADGFAAEKVLLIDDVTTTGATGSVCAGVLKAAGVKWVGFIALAHTVKS